MSEDGKISDLSPFQSITEIVEKRAVLFPDKVAFVFLNGKGEETELTYSELYEEAKKIAAYLQKTGKKGDRVLLLFPQGLDFIKSFMGCLMAGMIAVPSYPPKKNKKGAGLIKIIEDASPSIVLSISGSGFLSGIENNAISLCEIDKIEEDFAYSSVEISKEDIAFLQYTSGSTGNPKGVMVSHGNILHNELSIKEVFKMSANDILVGWLPFYHDMGLIGNILQSLFTGFKAILMAPIDFLQSPTKWLEAISHYKATVSGGPNFAYDLCVKSIDQEALKAIDLSSWKVAFNGAEPVSAKTLRDFHEKFKSCGFSFSSFYPCYGMAETTLLISGGSVSDYGNFTLAGTELVNCGSVSALDIKIITEDLQEQENGKVGEVIVSGESVAQGYWNDAVKTKENFAVQLKGKKYFRTGDLGIYSNNNLYIAGRIKDLIIINGRNYYPQDIEHLTGIAHDYLIPNSVAAFNVNEKLVVVAEAKLNSQTNKEQIINAVVSNLSTELELPIDELVLVRKGTLSKTTSGKIQRAACREAFMNEKLHEVFRLSSLTDTQNFEAEELIYTSEEKEILNVLKEELGKDFTIPRNQSFFNYGIDSVVIMRMVFFINERFNTDLSADVLYEYDTIEKLMKQIYASLPVLSTFNGDSSAHGKASSLQISMWINQQKNINSSAYNIPMFLDVGEDVCVECLRVATNNLLKKHKILRSTFDLREEKLYRKSDSVNSVNIQEYEVDGENQFNLKVTKICRKAFDLKKGPLFSFSVIKNKNGGSRVLFVIHHIIIDGTSLMIMVKELEERYFSIKSIGSDTVDISESRYFDKYVFDEQELLKGEGKNIKKKYWKNFLENYNEKIKLPTENTSISLNREGASIYFEFDSSFTFLIREFAQSNNINLFSCLLAGYNVFLSKISGSKDLVVGIPVSLRSKEEYLRASGLFINPLMFRSKIENFETFSSLVKKVYSNSREAIKNGNYPFGEILKDIAINGVEDQLALTSVYFNFLDFVQDESGKRFFDVYQSNIGVDINFDMNLYVLPEADIIRFRLDYCKYSFSEDSIKNLVSYFSSIIKESIAKPGELVVNIEGE
ncbi:MAG: AMP-binding protein, partial [Bacteroidetes bacterium]|nr:AMP-binding protein [Bacteroidota bacterium]